MDNVLEHLNVFSEFQVRQLLGKFVKEYFWFAKRGTYVNSGDRVIAILQLDNPYHPFHITTNALASCYISEIHFVSQLKIEIISYPVLELSPNLPPQRLDQ